MYVCMYVTVTSSMITDYCVTAIWISVPRSSLLVH
jgi:hypothetical protein